MANEDQVSHCDEEGEGEEPIKVSVTFKQQEQADKDVDGNSSPEGGAQMNVQSESEEPHLPINPPEILSTSFLDTVTIGCESQGTEQQEVLEGWKGYSNNIYIQPIIVNHASRDTCNCSPNTTTQRRLTSEDLRKQIRLRDAASWITKHNERIGRTGTLQVPCTSYRNKKYAASLKLEVPKNKSSRVHKGLVCRTWANEFLPQDKREQRKEEFSPFYVRKYVDESGLRSNSRKERNCPIDFSRCEEVNSIVSVDVSLQTDENKTCSTEKSKERQQLAEVEGNDRAILTKLFWRKEESAAEKREREVKSSQMASDGFLYTSIDKERVGENQTKYVRRFKFCDTERNQRTALPVKLFPTINPLQETKKPAHPMRKPCKISPNRRPHTVDTAVLINARSKRSGQYPSQCFPNNFDSKNLHLNILCGTKVATQPVKKINKENCKNETKNREGFDDVVNLLSSSNAGTWIQDVSRGETKTSQMPLYDGKSVNSGRVRGRSESDWFVNRFTSRSSSEARPESLNRFHGRQNASKKRETRTPPQSNSNYDSDSSDAGFGSEFEYSFDGSAKLDVYLKPRRMSFK